MAVLECTNCGGKNELPAGKSLGVCRFCGSQITLPRVTDENHVAAFNRGNHFRRIGEFDKALTVFERIVREDEGNAEAHWCCALCRFGIEYVQDDASGAYLPTCHRASYDSFLEDVDTLAALAHADDAARAVYQQRAEQIDEVLRGILAISRSTEPFDVFLCYKEMGADGQRTRDSQLAQDIYYQLTDHGLRVFFARITLEDKPGVAYEPYIFSALQSARVMVVVGTKPEHLNAVWVRNEWSRFHALMKHDRSRLLIPCYRDMDPYDMPDELAVLQGYDMSRIGFVQDLVRGIRKVVGAEEKPAAPAPVAPVTPTAQPAAPATEALLRRVALFLEDGDWKSADEYCERVLDIAPENARAYVGKLMAALHVTRQEKLKDQAQPFDRNPNYAKALRFADEELAGELRGMIAYINERNDNTAKEAAYQSAEQALTNAKTERDFIDAKKQFEALGGWKDAARRAQGCDDARMDFLYRRAEQALAAAYTEQDFTAAKKQFEALNGWRDAAKQAELCAEKAEATRKNSIYDEAHSSIALHPTEATLREAIRMFQTIPGWRDADQQVETCQRRIEELKAQAAEKEAARAAAKKAAQRRIGIGTAVLAAVVAVVLLVTQVIIPNGKYNAAVALMENGDYEAAIAAFKALDGYKDSQAQIDSCNTAIMESKYNAAMALMESGDYEAAVAAFEAMDRYKDSKAQIDNCNTAIMEGKYNAAVALMENGDYEAAIAAFKALDGYKDSKAQINTAIMEGKYNAAVALEEDGETALAAIAFGKLGDYKDARSRSMELWEGMAVQNTIAAGDYYTVGLRADGTVVAVGRNSDGQCNTSAWSDIIAIAASDFHTVGLRADGTVVAVGRNSDGQCNTSTWSDIVAIAAGSDLTVGLRADGTVVTVGYNDLGQCNTSSWSNIVAIAAGNYHTVGLRADGTVVAVGSDAFGQRNTSAWSDVVAIAAGDHHTVGLRADGSVVAVGRKDDGQCNTSAWSDIVAIAAGFFHTVGLRADGTVVAVGYNAFGQCNTSAWSDIVAIAAGFSHTVGLRADGTVVAVGSNGDGQCKVTDWRLKTVPRPTLPE